MKAFKKPKSKKLEYPAFTNFTIKVDVKKSWQDTLKKVLKSVQGVTTFRMGDDGSVNISGYVDPQQLLKCLKDVGKKGEMVHWQYGECSKNLLVAAKPPADDKGNEAGDYYFNPVYNGYGNGYGYGYGYDNPYGYNYGYSRFARNHAYNHLECAGVGEECSGHHTKQPNNSENTSTEQPNNSEELSYSIPKRITGSNEHLLLGENLPKCCSLM